MGMDVIGQNATDEVGEYFRNTVWWWRPLWDYCVELSPETCEEVDGGMNDAAGLDASDASDLAIVLYNEINAGRTAAYERVYNQMIADLPRGECGYCDATGVRTDDVGVQTGMPTKELALEIQIITGRTHGWCNACGGEGKVDDFRASYHFSVENVRDFADFLASCGGFAIC